MPRTEPMVRHSPSATALRWLRHPVVRGVLLALTFGCIGYALSRQWSEVQNSARALDIDWRWVAVATLIVLATYAALIQSWRVLLAGWGGHLPYGTAVRIWTIANLGRWVPGKVWSIGALGLLSRQQGVSGVAAMGASVLGTALNIGAGFAITVVTGAKGLDTIYPGVRTVAIVGTVVFVLVVLALPALLPALLNRFARWRNLPLADQHLSARDLWLATAINAASWIAYGVAFACFARGVTPAVTGGSTVFIAVFSASYLIGFLALFSPGGLGFREFALSGFLIGVGAAGHGDAAILSATSRVWLTVLEVLPGLIGLVQLTPSQRASLRQVD